MREGGEAGPNCNVLTATKFEEGRIWERREKKKESWKTAYRLLCF